MDKQYSWAVAFEALGSKTLNAEKIEGQVGFNIVAPTLREAFDKADGRILGLPRTFYFKDARAPEEAKVVAATLISIKRGAEIEV